MSIITNEERKYLLDNMKELLSKYDYDYEESSLDFIISNWAENKKSLIEAIKKHPNYMDGKFMIAFKHGFERCQDKEYMRSFFDYVQGRIGAMYSTIPNEIKERKRYCTYTSPEFWSLLDDFKTYSSTTIDENVAKVFEEEVPSLRVKVGQKTSRVINKLCTYLGISNDKDYNRKFAKYADAINPIVMNYNVVLSINPLDYLTMSFGNSWSSCHTIDKTNKRNMPHGYHGAYSSGTMSYMLDESSMVMYIVDEGYSGNEFWDQPKINRQMFHYSNNKLVQARLYPQSNDGDGSVYTPYRNIVQEIMSTVFDFPNLWTNKKGTAAIYPFVKSSGTHYQDYCNFSSCNISFAKDKNVDGQIYIGHRPICIKCGEEHDVNKNINCCETVQYKCPVCGYTLEEGEDEIIWVGGNAYCSECVAYCDECDCYYENDEVHYVESTDRYVCQDCLERYYVWCELCDQYELKSEATYIDGLGWVCESCLDYRCVKCDECGKYHLSDNVEEYEGRTLCKNCIEKEKE